MMDNLGAARIGDRFSVRRPHDAADTHIVVRNRGLGSVGEPADDEITSFSRALIFGAIASHERDAPAVRRRNKPAAAIGLAPRWVGSASRCRDLPQIAFMHKINAVAVFDPEGIGDSAFGKRRKRDSLAVAVPARDIQILYVRAVPDKRHTLAVGRPNGIRRMLDLNQLLNRERRLAARALRLQIACASQGRGDTNGRPQYVLRHAHSASPSFWSLCETEFM